MSPRLRARLQTVLIASAAVTLFSPNVTAENSAESRSFAESLRALDEGLPQVAAHKLRSFLQTNPPPAERRDAALALVRAFVAVPDGAAALNVLDAESPHPPTAADAADPALAFWRAQALAAAGRWSEARAFYVQAATLPGVDPSIAARARFGQGESLLALAGGDNPEPGQHAEAAALFRAIYNDPNVGELARLRGAEIALDSHHLKEAVRALGDLAPAAASGRILAKEHAYLVGRLRLAQRQPALARQIFTAALAQPTGLSARLLVDNYWGWARACLDMDQPDLAQRALENLLGHYPRQPFLEDSFNWLETLYGRAGKPDLTELRNWSGDDDEPSRQALARLTLAHLEARAGRPENAEPILGSFSANFPSHPLRARAWLDLAALRLNAGRNADARAALVQARQVAGADARWRTGLETFEAQLSLAENDSAGAARRFTALADRLGTGAAAEAAAFNAALAALRSGDAGNFDQARAAFTQRFPRSAFAAEFPLEEGLALAGQIPAPDLAGHQHAIDSLRLFLYDHSTHPRAGEARVALAELAFAEPPPNLAVARRELDAPGLRRISNDTPKRGTVPSEEPPAVRDRADYLALWLADAPGAAPGGEEAVTLAKKFLDERPDSPLAAEVRLKLGEIYFARGDYPDAQTQLELLLKGSPNSPLADGARYLAGRAAASSMSPAGINQAVEHFIEAARHDGPFRLPARLRLAEVTLGKPDGARDARTLYEGVLVATNGPAPLREPELDARCTALAGRGQTLIALAANDPELSKEAVKTFDELATGTPGASLRWRRQALTLKGHVLKETGDTEGALAAYDDALNATADPASATAEGMAPEWTWFYRAGSEAADLLKKQSQWAAAIAVYKKLAAADGPMKSEFEKTLANLRLEHFIWED